MDRAALKDEIDRLGPWLHDVEVAPGLRTSSARPADDPDKAVLRWFDPMTTMRRLVDDIYGGDLGGRSMLDCGCNAGGLSFAAAKLGAGRIVAFDARQHWLDQAAFLAERLEISQVRFERLLLSELPTLDLEPVDITLFSGLFYHLPDPIAGLKMAADLTKDLLIVNTAVKPEPFAGLVISQEGATQVLSGVDGLAWLPTGPRVMAQIFRWLGFPHVRVDRYWTLDVPRGWKRLQIVAARDEATFARYDRVRPDARLGLHIKPQQGTVRRVVGGVRRRLKALAPARR